MEVMADIRATLSEAAFSPSYVLSARGALHVAQIVLCLLTSVLANFRGGSGHTYWNYAMFTWAFCPTVTFFISIIELFGLDIPLHRFYLDWPDFATGMAMTSALLTLSAAATYTNFYACLTCVYGVIVSVFAFLASLVYFLEVVKDKFLDGRKGSYLSAPSGFFKVTEAFVSCVIFTSLTGFRDRPTLILCVVAYVLPFPFLPLIIVVNVLKKLRKCLPFDPDRFVLVYLVVSVALYAVAAVLWPVFMFRDNPRPSDCPPSFCIWAIQFMVAFMTHVNLLLFTLDLVFTLLGVQALVNCCPNINQE